jgi:hypothetical protein
LEDAFISQVILEDSIFEGCIASSSNGGSILLGSLSILTITSCYFSYSFALMVGGAVFADTSSSIFIIDSLFTNCSSGLNGGVLFLSKETSGFARNTSFIQCFSERGAVFYALSGSLLNLEFCILHGNTAVDRGGGIFLFSSASICGTELLFTDNKGLSGGVLHLYEGSSVIFRNCTFSMNQAVRFGGAIFADTSSRLDLGKCSFTRNVAGSGGSIFLREASEFILQNSSFEQNHAVTFSSVCDEMLGSGGAITFSSLNTSYVIKQNKFLLNYADRFGGALSFFFTRSSINDSLTIPYYGLFHNNSAGLYGLNYASPTLHMIAEIVRFFEYQGDLFDFKVHFFDAFNQNSFPKLCNFHILFDYLNGEGDPFLISPSSFLLDEITENQSLSTKIGFFFKVSLLSPPSVFEVINVSLKLAGIGLESNFVNLSIGMCPRGFALEADSILFYKCVPCLSGAFLNTSDPSFIRCAKCPSGKYSFALSEECIQCPEGRFSAESGGSDSCAECPLGTFGARKSQSFCSSCEVGKYNDRFGQSVCLFCPFDSITLTENNISNLDCMCPSGTFGNPLQGPCQVCKKFKGVSCEVNSSVPYVKTGFWRKPESVSVAQECFPAFACIESAFLVNTPCALNYAGRRCGVCVEGKYRSIDSCKNCPSMWLIFVVLLFIIAAVLGGCVYMIFFSKGLHINISFRPILVSIQSLGVLNRFFSKEISNSGIMDQVLSFLDLSNMNFELFFNLECISKTSFWDIFVFKILILLLFCASFLGICFWYVKCKSMKGGNVGSHPTVSVLDKCIALLLMLLSTFYTFVLGMILTVFRCYPPEDGTHTLLSSPSLDCYDSEWFSNLWIIIIGIMFLIYFPLLLAFILWKNRSKIYSNTFFFRYGILVKPYKMQFFYWEVILLIRKLILICLVDLTNGMPNTERAFILICFLILELFLDFLVNPFQEENVPIRELRNV